MLEGCNNLTLIDYSASVLTCFLGCTCPLVLPVQEMEKFRDHEKEYKSKKPTKAAMLNETEIKGKFNYGSNSSFDGDYDEEGEEGEESEGDGDADLDCQDINLDKQWLATFVTDTLRSVIGKYDTELDKIQNKKTKGGQKKNRDKINALKNKKSHLQ